jgi:hypothetical protein
MNSARCWTVLLSTGQFPTSKYNPTGFRSLCHAALTGGGEPSWRLPALHHLRGGLIRGPGVTYGHLPAQLPVIPPHTPPQHATRAAVVPSAAATAARRSQHGVPQPPARAAPHRARPVLRGHRDRLGFSTILRLHEAQRRRHLCPFGPGPVARRVAAVSPGRWLEYGTHCCDHRRVRSMTRANDSGSASNVGTNNGPYCHVRLR